MDYKHNSKDILKDILDKNHKNILSNIDSLNFRIAERIKLKEQTQKELERQKGNLEDLLLQYSYPPDIHAPVVASLRTKLVQLNQEIAMQEIEAFRDISELEKELREEKKQLREGEGLRKNVSRG
ncbi:MAG: hypothetical protein HY515_01475 [Candidatus Aenigmarchaeota archaeon]|nr:hypothetical protein [Candidatus Aenigmarchaeota archaeon]